MTASEQMHDARETPDIRGVISDLDGVVYRGAEPIRSAVDAFRIWASRGVPYCFVTNNSTRTPEEFAGKLREMGVAAGADQVVTSASATTGILRSRWPLGGRAYVIGAPSLMSAVFAAGFELVAEKADCVVVGLDREFTYSKLDLAVRCLRQGAALIATNPDLLLPTADSFEPGNGAIVAAIVAASGVEPFIVGKPKRHLLDEAVGRLGVSRPNLIMIGDQIETDIAAARAAEIFSVLVETGVEQRYSTVTPDLTVSDLSLLFAARQ